MTPIHGAERQIALMREYRTRLIADIVTGKVDVSAALNTSVRETSSAMPVGAVEETKDHDGDCNDDSDDKGGGGDDGGGDERG